MAGSLSALPHDLAARRNPLLTCHIHGVFSLNPRPASLAVILAVRVGPKSSAVT